MMTHPLSEPREYVERYVYTLDGFRIDLCQSMFRTLTRTDFYRHPNGGGFVASSSFVPAHVMIPWGVTVYEHTIVLDDADLVSAGTRICGNVSRVSRVATEADADIIAQAKRAVIDRFEAWVHQERLCEMAAAFEDPPF